MSIFEVFKTFDKNDQILSDLIKRLSNSKPELNFDDIKKLGFKDPKEIGELLLKIETAKFNNKLITVNDEKSFLKMFN